MATSLRLTKDEVKSVSKMCIEINKKLVKAEKAPIRDSELMHFILSNCVDKVFVNTRGELDIDPDKF